MSNEDYISLWKSVYREELYTATKEELKDLPLDNVSYNFLTEVGLPDTTGPYLDFELSKRPGTHGVKPITSVFDFLLDDFKRFIVIGYDGSGNPIVIDSEKGGEILLLNHDENFKEIFINSSITNFFESIIKYGKFGCAVIEAGADFFSFNDEQFNQLKNNLESVENKSISDNTFWKEELDMLLHNRDYYSQKNNK